MPYECPSPLREAFSDPKAVTIEEFDSIAEPVRRAILQLGVRKDVVQPHCSLLPSFLDIPSRPEDDFLWPGSSPLVTERVREKVESLKIREVAFAEVTLRKVGRESSKLPAPIPSSGEPEDVITEVRTTLFPDGEGRYFELCVYGRSAPPPGRELKSVCSTCGNKDFKWARSKELVMTESMWTGLDIFVLETTRIILVTEMLKQEIQKLGPTNVEFIEFPSSR
ncbi:MAG: hypothetical protein JNN07_23970 [Verrucomicrobiales bacterium]|nr:hypothetical protein [Verrucomicrobiales bacterium]